MAAGIPDMSGARLDQLLDEGLEQLHDIDLAARLGRQRCSAIDRSATRSSLPGSSPARRMSSCRHSQGVGTSLTVATRMPIRSESWKPGLGSRPSRKKGSRVTTSQKQTRSHVGSWS